MIVSKFFLSQQPFIRVNKWPRRIVLDLALKVTVFLQTYFILWPWNPRAGPFCCRSQTHPEKQAEVSCVLCYLLELRTHVKHVYTQGILRSSNRLQSNTEVTELFSCVNPFISCVRTYSTSIQIMWNSLKFTSVKMQPRVESPLSVICSEAVEQGLVPLRSVNPGVPSSHLVWHIAHCTGRSLSPAKRLEASSQKGVTRF